MAGSHSVGRYARVANGAQGSGRPKRPPRRRNSPIFRCNHGLGSLTARTPRAVLMDTTIVAAVMASHGRGPGALSPPALVAGRARRVDLTRRTLAGMYSSIAGYVPFCLAIPHRPNG